MGCNRLNNADQRFQGWSRLRELGKALQVVLQCLAPANPSRWRVTVVQGSHDGFLSIWLGRQLDVLQVMQISRHCEVYAVSRTFPVTDLAVAAVPRSVATTRVSICGASPSEISDITVVLNFGEPLSLL